MQRIIGQRRFALRHWLVMGFAALVLAACGGGGGGGGGSTPPPPSLTFTPDKTAISLSMLQGQTPPSTTITITATGSYSGTLYVAATASANGLAASIPIAVTGTTAVATVTAASGLAPGSYTGTLTLMACSDAACATQIGNSPLKVAFTVTVAPTLQVTPATVNVTAVSGAPTTVNLAVQLPQGQTTFTPTLVSGAPWLTIQSTTATGLTLALASLPSGTYTGNLQVASGPTFLASVPVTYTVTAPAGGDHPLSANPASLTLSTVENATTSAALAVTPPSWSPALNATVDYPAGVTGWLSLTRTPSGYTVTANAAGLTAGSYTATVHLSGAYPQSDVLVPVALTVGIGLVRPADVAVTVNAETTSGALTGSIPVTVAGGPPVTFTAQSGANWLVLTHATGLTGSSFTWTIDSTQLAALGNAADHFAGITITPSVATMTPVSLAVTLHEQLPQLTSLAPATHLNTTLNPQVVVRGSGFSAISNSAPLMRFAVDGSSAGVAAVVPVNDTEARLTLTPLAAGNHVISVGNALGVSTSTTNLTGARVLAYSYSAVPTAGKLRSLSYDASHDALLAANTTVGAVMRFAHGSGASWTPSSLPLANVYDVGLSTDQHTLLASTTSAGSSTLVALDPVTLVNRSTATLSAASPAQFVIYSFDSLGFGIPATNDGRSWLATGSSYSGFGQLSYVVPPSLGLNVVSSAGISPSPTFLGGPWYAASRNGERLLIVPTQQTTPAPMLYLDAADGIVHTNPANLQFSDYLSLSEDGSGILLFNPGTDPTLYDRSFTTIGTATLPGVANASTTYYPVASQISPDGTLVYVFSYRNDAATNGAVTPRVYVFGNSVGSTPGVLTELGHFDVTNYPSCPPSTSGCVPSPLATAISLDGQTLFVAGDSYLLVIPKPNTLTPLSVGPSGSAKQQKRGLVTTPWPLNLH